MSGPGVRRWLAAADAVARALVGGLGAALTRLGTQNPPDRRDHGDGPPTEDPRHR